MPQILVIAFGNPLRSDDGVAWRAAESLKENVSPSEVEIICLQQLGPELAETASRFECVIFVDAASGSGVPGAVQVRDLSRANSGPAEPPAFCHALSPTAILGMAAQLYGATAQAYSATVVGQDFDHGEALSPQVVDALPVLIARIQELIQVCLKKNRNS